MNGTQQTRGLTSAAPYGAMCRSLTVVVALVLVFSLPLRAQTYKVLYNFAGPPADGANATASLVRDASGKLYGTTRDGGNVSSSCAQGCGVVFRLSPAGKEKVLHAFAGDSTEGASAYFGLVRDAAGNLYGTTQSGGALNDGAVYRINPTGKETVLYSFAAGADGAGPSGVLVRDGAGNLYGTAETGGGIGHQGIVFKLNPAGKETILYSFTGGADGSDPAAGVIRSSTGNLYGTTYAGGSSNKGEVFRVSPAGKEKVLYSFTGGADGGYPRAGLVQDKAGNFYGTTTAGGTGFGTVFKLTPAGKEIVLYSFTGAADGSVPAAGVIRDAAGNFYGTTLFGGSGCGCGVVFKVATRGKETVLHTFAGGTTDGSYPFAGLVRDAAGNFYGTASSDGAAGFGVVFRIKP
jgi:uncharacterized repeat protein (TIGR03803 family)